MARASLGMVVALGLCLLGVMGVADSTGVGAEGSPYGSVLISEVMYHPGDDFPQPGGEWIELHNRGPEAVDLANWTLRTGQGSEELHGSIVGGGFLLVVASDQFAQHYPWCDNIFVVADGRIGGGLSDTGDEMSLVAPNGLIVDAMSYGECEAFCGGLEALQGQTLQLARLEAGTCAYVADVPSPGQLFASPTATPASVPTATTTMVCTDTPTVAPTATATPTPTATVPAGALLLTEVQYQGDCGAEWLEVANVSRAAVLADRWTITDNYSTTTFDLSLAPGEIAILHGCDARPEVGCAAIAVPLLSACLGNGLADDGDRVELRDNAGRLIDAMSYGLDSTYGVVLPAPPGMSLGRAVAGDGSLGPWQPVAPAPGCLQLAATPTEPRPTATLMATPDSTPTPAGTSVPTRQTPTETPEPAQEEPARLCYFPFAALRAAEPEPPVLLISEVLYAGATADEGDEFIEIRNYTGEPISLEGYKVGDAECLGDGEGMYAFPAEGTVPADGTIVVARCAQSFMQRFGQAPSYEFCPGTCRDTPEVPNLVRYTSWGRGTFNLANDGDEVLLLGPGDVAVDAIAYASGQFGVVGVDGDARAKEPLSLHRVGSLDNDDMSLDFSREEPSPGAGLNLPTPVAAPPGPTWAGLTAYWGNLHAHSSYSDGAGPPELAFARARAAGLHFYAVSDHACMLRLVEWRHLRVSASEHSVPGAFIALAGFEWTHRSEGHVNIFNTVDITSRDDPFTDALTELYRWLGERPDALAQFNHPGLGGTFGGQEDPGGNRALVSLQEVGNGSDESKPQRVFQEELLSSWNNGWRLGPTFGSDTHDCRWGEDTAARTGVWLDSLTESAIMSALRSGRVFASEDQNLAIGWQCDGAFMGDELDTTVGASCRLFYWDGEGEEATVSLHDVSGLAIEGWFLSSGDEQSFSWPEGIDAAWLLVTQGDGDLAWGAPIWRACDEE